MTSFFDKYRRRVQASGSTIGEALANNIKASINNSFEDSPDYKQITISRNGLSEFIMDVRMLTSDKMGTLRDLITRPDEDIRTGDIVKFDNEIWIAVDSFSDGISTKAVIQQCNDFIRWVDRNGVYHEFPCVASTLKYIKYDIAYNKYDVKLLEGGVFIFVQSNTFIETIEHSQRFIFGSQVYQITGIDDLTSTGFNREGLVQFTSTITTRLSEDDFVGGIANNDTLFGKEYGDSGSGSTGGELW